METATGSAHERYMDPAKVTHHSTTAETKAPDAEVQENLIIPTENDLLVWIRSATASSKDREHCCVLFVSAFQLCKANTLLLNTGAVSSSRQCQRAQQAPRLCTRPANF